MLLILASDPLRPRRADPHWTTEAVAARAAGFDVAYVDHDGLTRGDATEAVRGIGPSPAAIYRGWMLRSEQYAAFADALAERGVELLTTAEQYQQAHELPGWYEALKTVTPQSVWTVGADRTGFDQARQQLGLGPAVLRDWTKSMKHYWAEAAFIPELADVGRAWAIAARFLELREDDFTGGFVLRRFETFTSAEARSWWIGGHCALIGPHPDTPDELPPPDVDASHVAPLVADLALPFVTVDLAQQPDGGWRVIELGDGQVSDRPASVAPELLIEALTHLG